MAALVCSTCGGSPESPYRANGEGCVSGAHDDHADAWHLRPEAEAIRKGETWRLLVPDSCRRLRPGCGAASLLHA